MISFAPLFAGCAALEAIGPVSSAVGAWYSFQANDALRTSDCAWARKLDLSDGTISAAPRDDLEQLVAHNRAWEENCQ